MKSQFFKTHAAVENSNAFALENMHNKWLNTLRSKAFQKYEITQWPSAGIEEYRRTDLSAFPFEHYHATNSLNKKNTPPKVIRKGSWYHNSQIGTYHTNWHSGSNDSTATVQPIGYTVTRLDHATTVQRKKINTLFEEFINGADNKLQLWHASHFEEGAIVTIEPNAIVDKPILIEYFFTEAMGHYSPHTIINVSEGAKATVIIRYLSEDGVQIVCNAATTIECKENAYLRLIEEQELGDESTFFYHGTSRCKESSHFERTDITLGSRLSKSRFTSLILGERVRNQLNGIYCLKDNQHADIKTIQSHQFPHSTSNAQYRGAVKGSSRSIYQGLIDVAPRAIKTDAFLTNNNLVLNNGARADSIPALRIATNDVKCSHGSTTGKIPLEQLFYLMSRGIKEAEAKKMIILGFFETVISQLPTFIVDKATQRLSDILTR